MLLNAWKMYNNQLLRKYCVDIRHAEDIGKVAVILHGMKAYRGKGVWLCSFFTLALDGG
jgi:hypothetical protein